MCGLLLAFFGKDGRVYGLFLDLLFGYVSKVSAGIGI